jgi:uncharacterized protein (TIGR02594 family)
MDNPPWLDIAYEELAAGVVETPGPKATPRIIDYFAATWQAGRHEDDSGKEHAWCAAFVTFCLEAGGIHTQKAVGARSYEGYGEACAPFRGAIVVLERLGQKHVTFLAGIDRRGLRVYLGGNQANRVSLASFPLHAIVACRKPKGYVVPIELEHLGVLEAGEGESTV